MKIFRDSTDTDWTVFEVRRQATGKADSAYLPSGFNDGWLCFESATAKRRLVHYPERWREFSDTQLEQLLAQATPAPRMAFHLGEDLGVSSPAPDLLPD